MGSLPIELLLRQLKLSTIVGGSLGFLVAFSFLALVGQAGHFFSLLWMGDHDDGPVGGGWRLLWRGLLVMIYGGGEGEWW
jgi:hypothetical protein